MNQALNSDQVNDVLAALTADYQRFPDQQTYSLYADDVYFKDPLNEFVGIKRYKSMIQFIQRWFLEVELDLQQLQVCDRTIKSEWTLQWIAPLPWRPQMVIAGWSELTLNPDGLIASHIDYWNCSVWSVFLQLWQPMTKTTPS